MAQPPKADWTKSRANAMGEATDHISALVRPFGASHEAQSV
jgi:hypothetical protein